MAWDIAVKTKVYHLLANEIFFRIYNGTYPPGVKLSSFPVFAKEVGSSPETVRKAISEYMPPLSTGLIWTSGQVGPTHS